MNLLKRYLHTSALGVACLVAILGLGLEYWLLARKLSRVLQTPVTATQAVPTPQPSPPTLPDLPPLEAFSAFVEQPLFVEGRKPLPEETEATSETGAEKKQPDFRLTGIITTPEAGQMILVQNQSNKTLRFRLGESIDGWRVAELKEDQVLLERGGETYVLKLIKPRPIQPSSLATRLRSPSRGQAPNPFAQAAAQQKKE
ncbi:MAG: hypothetical protein N3A55_02825 [Methylohalobius sp.]|nr:hypothetical protein [Methylohalobius sp.]